MTARSLPFRRTLLASALAAISLGVSGMAQAEDRDVNSTFGRAAPSLQNYESRSARDGAGTVDTRSSEASRSEPASAMRASGSHAPYPVTVSQAQGSQTPPQSTGAAGEYLTTAQNPTASPDAVITPTGQYLAVEDGPTAIRRDEEVVVIHERQLDGVPLTEGRGMRPVMDYYAAAPVQSDAQFDVTEVLGRASPPAPESAKPYFGAAG